MQGLFLSGDEWLKGQRAKYVLLTRTLNELFANCDVVVQTDVVPFDIIGLPELALPIGFQPSNQAGGLPVPIGAIFGALPYGEERLLALAATFQAVTDFHLARPPDPIAASARAAFAAGPVLRLTAEEAEAMGE